MAFIKQPREVDQAFLTFIRSLPCSICNDRAEPHHLVSRGAWGSDYTCIPLCREHHTEIESIGKSKFEFKFKVEVWKIAHKILLTYFTGESWNPLSN